MSYDWVNIFHNSHDGAYQLKSKTVELLHESSWQVNAYTELLLPRECRICRLIIDTFQTK